MSDIAEQLRLYKPIDNTSKLINKAADSIEELRKQHAAGAEMLDRLHQRADRLQEKLAASQAREAKLREALEHIHPDNIHDMERRRKALALPTDDSALQERLKQERERIVSFVEVDGTNHELAAAIRALT